MNYITSHPFISIIVAFSAAIFILAWLIARLYRRWSAVFGKKVQTHSEAVTEATQRLNKVEKYLNELDPRVNILEDIARVSIQKVGFMRFNPFGDTGGDQSFTIALLDNADNGIIISSLYTREGVRTYAKEVKNGVSKHLLSEEEKTVLGQAMT